MITDGGGVTCHAAIVSRELQLPCVVGTGNATTSLRAGQEVTVDGRTGKVYAGAAAPITVERPTQPLPEPVSPLATRLYVNLAVAEHAEEVARCRLTVSTEITEQFITTAHTGRAKLAEGEERARGATALDDWVDSRMVLTREGDDRFLFAEGRGKVEMLETKLIFDQATNLSRIGEGDRKATREVNDVNAVVEIVTGSPGINTRSLTEAVREKIPSHNQDHASKAIAAAKKLGLVHTVDRKNNAKLFHLGPDPAWAVQQQWADMYARQ